MKIRLNQRQTQLMQPYLDRVKAAYAMGSPGMLVAQVSHEAGGFVTLTPAFLDNDIAKLITEKGRAEIPGPMNQRLEKRRDETDSLPNGGA